ncbi:MAG TPA: sporulation integral membrane protein YtvI [Clostridiales bacterium]|nr:sporulation integral membrane protein YtvI [Clostridiales bacterium]
MANLSNIKRARLLKIGLALLGVIVGVFLIYKLSVYITPFIIAFVIASIIEPIIRFFMRRAKMPRKVAAPIVLTFFIVSFGLIITLIIVRLIDEMKSVATVLPKIVPDIYAYLNMLLNKGIDIFEWLPPEITDNIGNLVAKLSESLSNILNSIIKGAYITAVSIPEALVFTVITIVSTYFMSSDRERISKFFSSQFPEKWINKGKSIIENMFSALIGYIKAQLILMMITFTELFIGFTLIRVRYSLLLAFIISFLDALPILGTGGFLTPWAIYSFLTGNIRLGISLLILYGVVLIVRQSIEPRILGQQIGVYPLVTLIAMYSGLKLFGFIGFILGPILVLMFKNILSGILKNRSIKDILEHQS